MKIFFQFLLQNGRLDPLSSTSNPGLIRLFCIRHGERIDFAFGPTWPELAFDKSGNAFLAFFFSSKSNSTSFKEIIIE